MVGIKNKDSIDKNRIVNLFKGIALSESEITFIANKFTKVKVKKSEILVKQNNAVQHQYYVLNGCLRTYHVGEGGKEYTIQFAIEDWWISDYIGYFGNQKSVFNIECIKEAELYKISKPDLEVIYDEVPKVERFFRKKIEKAFVRQEIRILANLTDTAKERYLSFLKMYPDIEKHLKNYHIASYLGVTTESLSRIRKEIATR